MAPPEISEVRSQVGLLLILTRPNGALRRIAELREKAARNDRGFTDFLRYFQAEVFELFPFIYDFKTRLASYPLPSSVTRLLGLLDRLVVSLEGQNTKTQDYGRLRILADRMGSANQDDLAEEEISKFMDFGDAVIQREILKMLATAVDDLEFSMPVKPQYPRRTASDRSEPNYEARKWNNELFDALSSTIDQCEGCGAPTATLALLTHRKSLEGLEMQALLAMSSLEAVAQEVKLQISSIQWVASPFKNEEQAPNDPSGQKSALTKSNAQKSTGKRKIQRYKIAHLCEPLRKAQKSHVCLHFVAEDKEIWLENRSRAMYSGEELRNIVSLTELSTKDYTTITDQTKLVIAVILGHTLLHFWDTPWLHDWSRETIVFIQSTDTVPLKPFMLSHPLKQVDNSHDMFLLHHYPSILSLGIMLLELDLQQSLDSYLQPKEKDNINSNYLNALEAFKKHQANMYKNYRLAIDACLEQQFADNVDPDEDPDGFRRQIYLRIVKPLEDELENGFGEMIDIDDLDEAMRKLNIVRYPIPTLKAPTRNLSCMQTDTNQANSPRTSLVERAEAHVTTSMTGHLSTSTAGQGGQSTSNHSKDSSSAIMDHLGPTEDTTQRDNGHSQLRRVLCNLE